VIANIILAQVWVCVCVSWPYEDIWSGQQCALFRGVYERRRSATETIYWCARLIGPSVSGTPLAVMLPPQLRRYFQVVLETRVTAVAKSSY